MLSWGWQWALSWDLPIRPVLASKDPSHVVLIQVMELDRAAFVQGFANLISLLFYSSGSWHRCAGATALIAFLSFLWFMFPCIVLFYDTPYFRLGVTFLSSGHTKQLVKDPQWLPPNNWGRIVLTAGLVVGSGLYLSSLSLYFGMHTFRFWPWD